MWTPRSPPAIRSAAAATAVTLVEILPREMIEADRRGDKERDAAGEDEVDDAVRGEALVRLEDECEGLRRRPRRREERYRGEGDVVIGARGRVTTRQQCRVDLISRDALRRGRHGRCAVRDGDDRRRHSQVEHFCLHLEERSFRNSLLIGEQRPGGRIVHRLHEGGGLLQHGALRVLALGMSDEQKAGAAGENECDGEDADERDGDPGAQESAPQRARRPRVQSHR